jgi:signal transduction histidine kinase
MHDKKIKINQKLNRWLIIPTVIVMISSVCIYASVDFVDNYIVLGNRHYDAIRAIGMFFPMGVVVGTISYFGSRMVMRFTSRLTSGISQIANGNFGFRLDPEKAGPMKETFINFNKMGAELQSVQTLHNDFINSFSHEFKTPITSINGFATLLLEENVTEEDRRKYLQIIADESERLAAMSSNTLLLSKLESQQFITDKKPYSLDEQIKRCAILLSKEWGRKEINFSAELEPVIYNGNTDLMQQVWINLLSNAIKFTPEHGEITVKLRKEKDCIKVEISDTGKGMSEEEIARIFVKYYQGDASHSNKGLGLGLSIAKRIIDLCGGKIEVTSVIDEGSTFTVYLPCFR